MHFNYHLAHLISAAVFALLISSAFGAFQECEYGQISVNGVCQVVPCSDDSSCSQYQDYCKGIAGEGSTKAYAYCGIAAPRSCKCMIIQEVTVNFAKKCNRNLDGSSKCDPGQICSPKNQCIDDPKCGFTGEKCSPSRGCCGDLMCHSRKGYTETECYATAFVGEDCSSGIPCELGSECLQDKKICSKRDNDGCDDREDMCRSNSYCEHTGLASGVNKACTERIP
jgi:hypothetical protein